MEKLKELNEELEGLQHRGARILLEELEEQAGATRVTGAREAREA